MTNTERLKLADNWYRESHEALVNFAAFHLPQRIRARFVGNLGEKVFVHSAVYGNPVWPPEHERQYGDAACRGQKFLVAIPRFRKLFESNFDAYTEWSDAKYQEERDYEADAISIEDTYRMIDREMIADVREECREHGLAG
ncbi:hypothetical protein A8H39_01715 [Paraburkholderia fungorum]|uniref:hypothetical protein n=1 Tax=Paraburkholderia fungorum TaxID=134537 RepID=UPI00048765CE|nr:hypothetical protein [Paraburkholderia fungorum]PNE59888.1 hypothetical protein A8H39_01715 [Paraburkholderia fungorum]